MTRIVDNLELNNLRSNSISNNDYNEDDIIKVSKQTKKLLYNKYPQLAPSSSGEYCAKHEVKGCYCNNTRIKGDKYCLQHTKKIDLFKFEIPYMCNVRKKNNRRCTNRRLENEEMCLYHYKKLNGLDAQCRSQSRKALNVKIEKRKLSDKALKSQNSEEWVNLSDWNYKRPRDITKLLEETINRVRRGTIPMKNAQMVGDLSQSLIMAIMSGDELKPDEQNESEMKKEIINNSELQKAKCNVIDFASRIKKHTSNIVQEEIV